MLNKRYNSIIILFFFVLSSCMKEIDGPLDIQLSPYPKIELNLDQANRYKAKIYYNLSTKSIVKTSDNLAWHIAFSSNPNSNSKVIMNYAFGQLTWGATLDDTVWSRNMTQDQLFNQVKIYANHYDSFANLFSRGLNNVYYLNYGANLSSKKLQIINYTSTEVTFRFANIDGSSEQTKTVSLNPNTNFTYVSLIDGSTQDIEPEDKMSWDFEVTRFTTFVTDFSQPQMYGVGGFIANPSKAIQVAKIESRNLEDISGSLLLNLVYSSRLTELGHDWKKFSNGGDDGFYTIFPRSYIVQSDGKTYGLQFISYSKSIDGKPFNGYPLFLQRDF